MRGGTNQSGFLNGAFKTSFYHNIASVIISCIQKRSNFITRGLMEVKNLQAENFTSEKFTISTYTRLLEGFEKDFLSMEQETELHIFSLVTGTMKVSKGKLPSRYRLIFNPLDNILNFSRGMENVGLSFSLEGLSEKHEANYKGIFAGFYHFKQQKLLYGREGEIAHLENRRIKAIHRQNGFLVSVNSACVLSTFLTEEKLKSARIKQISISESPVTDILLLAGGAIDGIIYHNIKLRDVIPLTIIAPPLGVFTSAPKFEKQDLLQEINFTIGSSNFIKSFPYSGK